MSNTNALKNLETLISSMEPILNEGEFVFATVTDIEVIPRNVPICEMKESEGTTVVLPKEYADIHQIPYEYITAWITLNVHSALDAVGLTAAFATALGNGDISCNVIAGYYHDHIFVAFDDATKAMNILKSLSLKHS